MLKELIDFSTLTSSNDQLENELDCVLLSFSSKLGRDGAQQIAKIVGRHCPNLDLNVRRHRRGYALEVKPNEEKNVEKSSADHLLMLKRRLDAIVTNDPEDQQLICFGQNDQLQIPSAAHLVSFLQSESGSRLIYSIIPLHQLSQLSHLQTFWVFASPWEVLRPPIGQIKAYFGPEIALYFAWLSHFTIWLIIPALIGTWMFIQQLFSSYNSSDFMPFVMFALFNAIWAIGFLRSWKQHQQKMTAEWTHIESIESKWKEKRNRDSNYFYIFEHFFGIVPDQLWHFLTNPKSAISSQFWRSSDFLSVCCLLAVLLGLLQLQDWAKEEYGSGWLSRTSIVLQGLVCIGAESLYRNQTSTKLENNVKGRNKEVMKGVDDFNDNALISRLALFHSISAFCPLFYIAFWLGDWERLQDTLATLLITRQFVQNFTEIGIPLALGQLRQLQWAFLGKMGMAARRRANLRDESITSNTTNLGESIVERQVALSEYGNPVDDYLEMFVQLGYVLLFSSAFPPAALCAFINNLLEARVDAFKLLCVHRRPWPRPAPQHGDGGWQNAIKIMCLAGVWVNLVLILLRFLTIENNDFSKSGRMEFWKL